MYLFVNGVNVSPFREISEYFKRWVDRTPVFVKVQHRLHPPHSGVHGWGLVTT